MAHSTRHPSAARRPTPLVTVASRPASVRRAIESDSRCGTVLRHLADEVGGVDALERLDDAVLLPGRIDAVPLAPVHRAAVDDIRWVLTAGMRGLVKPRLVGEDRDGHLRRAIDGEYLVIADRILLRLAELAPDELFRSSVERMAAAIAWLSIVGNRRPWSAAPHPVPGTRCWSAFGVSSCAELAHRLRDDLGVPRCVPQCEWLADAELLHSRVRADIIEERTYYLARYEQAVPGPADPAPSRPAGRHLRIVR